MEQKDIKPDNREYTIKIIPNQGENVKTIRLSANLLKYGAASLAAAALLFVGAFSYATYSNYSLSSKSGEIDELRQVNNIQQEQLLQLSQKANGLQEQLDKLEEMESELRQLSGAAAPDTSDGSHDGQGGPYPVVQADVDSVSNALNNLEQKIEQRRQSLEQLKAAMANNQYGTFSMSVTTPSIWPAAGDVSSPFGMRWGGSDYHPGIDIANDYGTPICATADGVVTTAGWNSGGYGNMVDIDHGNGITTRYGHAQQVVVSAGQTVKRGQIIAYMGSTGFSTGPHVHYEVRVGGQAVNPTKYL